MEIFLIGTDDVARLKGLRELAAASPINIKELMVAFQSAEGKLQHKQRMEVQTVVLRHGPFDFFVTFSIETAQPCGTCRHMSMSIMRKGTVPSTAAVWLVAEELGFSGGLTACSTWFEDLTDGGVAVNVIQPISVQGEAARQ